MKITLTKAFKSLQPFESDELQPLTIITGKNGSGKSQLVHLFNELSKSSASPKTKPTFLLTPNPKSIYADSLIVASIQDGNPAHYSNKFTSIYSQYTQISNIPPIEKAWRNMFKKNITEKEISQVEMKKFEDVDGFKNFLSSEDVRFVNSDLEHLNMQVDTGVDSNTVKKYAEFLKELKGSFAVYEAAFFVAKYHEKDIIDLEQNDFLNCNLPDKYLLNPHLIHSKVEDLFYNYLRKRHRNDFDYYKKTTKKWKNSSVSPEEFDKTHKNPITQINEILNTANLPYYFKEVEESKFHPESVIRFDFIKKTSEKVIEFNNLSSGEKIIIGLIIKLFCSEYFESNLTFPDLIVLDEPDAQLHPEMSKLLLDVLYESFVKKLGIKVILTTHSPATIALAPEDSIYQLNNEPKTTLKKIDKDEALKILTAGLPRLSIDYKNHRQVFVESPTDLEYYQTIFSKLFPNSNLAHQLYFISPGYGKSNNQQVKKIVAELRKSGNNSIYGIIDWDNENVSKDFVQVHGAKSRYTIENYLFDPIFLSILLLEANFGKAKKAIGHGDTENQYDIIKSDKAQKAIDYVVSVLEPLNTHGMLDKRKEKVSYGEYTYEIPKWFLNMKGHTLKEQCIDQFEYLQSVKTGGEQAIERKLINIIGKLYPNVPSDTIELLTTLAT